MMRRSHDKAKLPRGGNPSRQDRFPTLIDRPPPLDMSRFRLENGFVLATAGKTALTPPYEFYGQVDVLAAKKTLQQTGQLWRAGTKKTFEGELSDFIVEARDDLPQIAQNFSEPVRWHASARGTPAPIEVWNAYSHEIISKRISMRFNGKIMTKEPMTATQWETASRDDRDIAREYLWALTRMATHFKVGWAIGIMQVLMGLIARDHVNPISILDPSAGWGDRLSASLLLGLDPTSVDPNPALTDPWQNIIAAIGGDAVVAMIPFEEYKSDRKFNIVFTSPPYRPDDEKYTAAPGQAAAQDSWEVWFREFVAHAWDSVDTGGCLAMHISNTRFCPAYDLLLSAMGRRPDKIIGVRGGTLWTVPVWIKN